MGPRFDWSNFEEPTEFPDRFKFVTPNDHIAGTITNLRVTNFGGKSDDTPEIWIDTGQAELSIVASEVNLRRQLSQLRPRIGDRIAIVFTGLGKVTQAGRSAPKLFEIEVKPGGVAQPDTPPPATSPASPRQPEEAQPVAASNLI